MTFIDVYEEARPRVCFICGATTPEESWEGCICGAGEEGEGREGIQV